MIFPQFFHLTSLVPFILFFISIYGQANQQYLECLNGEYTCGQQVMGITYPFWGNGRPSYCGPEEFQLTCHDNEYTTINIKEQIFRVLHIDQRNRSMTIVLDVLWDNLCPQVFTTISLNHTLYSYGPTAYENLTLFYNCSEDITVSPRRTFNCEINELNRRVFFEDSRYPSAVSQYSERCSNMTVPVLREAIEELKNNVTMELREVINLGFEVVYHIDNISCSACQLSGGLCWTNTTSLRESTCLCRNGIHPVACQNSGENINFRRKIIIGFAAAGFGVFIMSIIFLIYLRRNKKRFTRSYFTSRNISSSFSSDLEKTDAYGGVQVFSYTELEQATNNFDPNKELGDGGFGTVYKGKLKDGRVVAVKRLYENNYKRVKQFMNEVALLTCLRHQNLVSLYGCTTHRCRELLLVYEYVPNGTVADHLHGDLAKPGSLTWAIRISIATETASALVYLHASQVIHRDVKTNNILLDKNFSVKVADFGLSRLFPTNVTHVSTAPQGTPGYVDPEYHECYQLTNKSDVFSFGVVLMELISSKPAVDITRHRHEINLSNMAIKKIRNHTLHELVDPCLGFETDYKVRKMVRAVAELAFQCLQGESDMRPSMEQVLEELMRIQSTDYDVEEMEDEDFSVDDVGLLKNNVQTLSPDTFSVKWLSNSTSSSSGPIG